MDAPANTNVTLTMDGTNQSLALPMRNGTIGPSVADISSSTPSSASSPMTPATA